MESKNISLNEVFNLTSSKEEIEEVGIGLYQVPPEGVLILICLYLMVALTAIIGNTMVLITVIRSKKLRGVTNYFIANLAAADIMIAALAIPFTFQAALLQKWVLPVFMCSFCPFIQTLSVNVSIFTLVAVALDRFRAVIYPLRARTSHLKTKLCIIPIWIFSFILSIPTYIALDTRIKLDDPSVIVCDIIGFDVYWWKLYNNMIVVLQYFVPLIVIVIAYTAMGIKLYNENSNVVCARSDSGQVQENRKKVVKMMVIVVVLFGSCWLPYQMYNILSEIYPQINDYFYINLVFFAFHLLAMSNSCFNPFIYFLYSELYNSEMRTYFSWFFPKRQEVPNQSLRSTIGTEAEMMLITNNANNVTQGGSTNNTSANNSPMINSKKSSINNGETTTSTTSRVNNNQRGRQSSVTETIV